MTAPDDLARSIAALPPLRTVIAEGGLRAQRALGQNFLLDLNLTARIARAAGPLDSLNVIEVGPGPGGLTRALLSTGAQHVVAIERDRRCAAALAPLCDVAGGRLSLVEADVLDLDPAALAPPPRAIVANLPYNIATVLLIRWLEGIDAFVGLTLMFQREVAERLVTAPRTRAYGRLSVITQWRTDAAIVLSLPPRAFTPSPKVDSAVVRLTPKAEREPVPFAAVERVTAAAFGQRRKMLRQSLKALGDAEALIAHAGLTPTARAEEIPVDGFLALARCYADRADPPASTPPEPPS